MPFASFHDYDWPAGCTWTMDRRATHCYRYAPPPATQTATAEAPKSSPAAPESIRRQVQREVEKLIADVMNTLLLFPDAAAAVREVLYRNLHPDLAGARQPA